MDFRFHRLRLAVAGSIGVKLLGLAIQVIAYPVAIAVLGVDRFGVFVVLNSSLAFLYLSGLGIGPGLTMRISAASARNDADEAARLFSSAFFLLLGISALAAAVGLVAAFELPIHELFGDRYDVEREEVRQSLAVFVIAIALTIFTSVGPTARDGYLEQYKNSIFNAIGHVVSIGLLVFVVPEIPTIPVMIIATTSSLIVAQLLNTVWLTLIDRRHLLPRLSRVSRVTATSLLRTGTGFLVMRIGAVITLHVTSVFLGTMGGPVAIAEFAVVLRVVYVLWGVTQMFTNPFWPALSDAVASKDITWATRASRRLIVALSAIGLCGAMMLALVGDDVIRVWIGGDVRPSSMMFAFMGLYFFLSTWGNVMDTIVIGMGRIWIVAIVYVFQGILTVCLAIALIEPLGAYGAAVALCVGALCGHVWAMPVVARREFTRLGREVGSGIATR